MKILEKWEHLLGNGMTKEYFLWTNRKAFEVLNYSLLLGNLDGHGFSLKSTTFIQSYKRKQKSNVNNTLYAYSRDFYEVQEYSKKDFETEKWFYDSYMVLNPHKCEFMSFGKTNEIEVFTYYEIRL